MLSAMAKDAPKVNNENSVRRKNVTLIGVLISALVGYAYAAVVSVPNIRMTLTILPIGPKGCQRFPSFRTASR